MISPVITKTRNSVFIENSNSTRTICVSLEISILPAIPVLPEIRILPENHIHRRPRKTEPVSWVTVRILLEKGFTQLVIRLYNLRFIDRLTKKWNLNTNKNSMGIAGFHLKISKFPQKTRLLLRKKINVKK